MTNNNSLKKIEDEKKLNIQKTINHPIKEALKGGELKDTIGSNEKNQKTFSPNQISISLDKYENKIIRNRKSK